MPEVCSGPDLLDAAVEGAWEEDGAGNPAVVAAAGAAASGSAIACVGSSLSSPLLVVAVLVLHDALTELHEQRR
eukprot:4641168-Pleurochrysis_carterae.AAC.1